MDNKQTGQLGENIACYYLKNKGYKILEKNYRKEWSSVAKGEIDIIVKPRRNAFGILQGEKDDTIHFIEVKTLSSLDSVFLPEQKVNFQKQRQIIKLAQIWLTDNKIPLDSKWQIDVVSISFNPRTQKAKIKHFENTGIDLT